MYLYTKLHLLKFKVMTERQKNLQASISNEAHTKLWNKFAILRKAKKEQGIKYTISEFVNEILLKSLA